MKINILSGIILIQSSLTFCSAHQLPALAKKNQAKQPLTTKHSRKNAASTLPEIKETQEERDANKKLKTEIERLSRCLNGKRMSAPSARFLATNFYDRIFGVENNEKMAKEASLVRARTKEFQKNLVQLLEDIDPLKQRDSTVTIYSSLYPHVGEKSKYYDRRQALRAPCAVKKKSVPTGTQVSK